MRCRGQENGSITENGIGETTVMIIVGIIEIEMEGMKEEEIMGAVRPVIMTGDHLFNCFFNILYIVFIADWPLVGLV